MINASKNMFNRLNNMINGIKYRLQKTGPRRRRRHPIPGEIRRPARPVMRKPLIPNPPALRHSRPCCGPGSSGFKSRFDGRSASHARVSEGPSDQPRGEDQKWRVVASDSFAEFLREQLAPLGGVTMRRMFGKTGVFCDGLMLGMVRDNTLYFRVDDHNRATFKEAQSFPPLD
jgi:TfoX-like protein